MNCIIRKLVHQSLTRLLLVLIALFFVTDLSPFTSTEYSNKAFATVLAGQIVAPRSPATRDERRGYKEEKHNDRRHISCFHLLDWICS